MPSYSLFRSKFKKSVAESIYNEVVTKTSRYFHFLGKENSWSDYLSPFIPSSLDDVPGVPQNNFRYELHVRRDILSTKLITPSDISFIAPRYDWNLGEIYDMYDDAITDEEPAHSGATVLENAKFYVVTNEFNVYKCLSNNYNSPSTVMPTGTSVNTLSTSDGYKWKFMYTIPVGLRNKFLSTQYIPVTTALKSQFYSSGEIIQVTIENGGQNYSSNATATISGNGYLKENPYIISGVTITDAGHGYSVPPSIQFSTPTATSDNQSLALATVTINGDGSIDSVSLIDPGYGYEYEPLIIIPEPVTGALIWEPETEYELNDIVKHNENYYTVVIAGTTGLIPPTHNDGINSNGTATLTFLARQAVLTPTLVKTEAGIDLIIDNGEIVGVSIVDGGTAYTYATITVTDSTGLGANLVPNFNVGNIDTLQANIELLAIPGTIDFIKVIDGGQNYGSASVNIIGDGQGATAVATVLGGEITKIDITNPGYGYTWSDVVISGNGSGATARAIMSPLRGHGKDAVDELNANSIAFYSVMGKDSNQGLTITNDYRKIGLLKNIRQFGSTNRYTQSTGSGCILITGNFDSSKIEQDMLLVGVENSYKQYRVVEFTDNQILLSVFNNFSINIGDTLQTPSGDAVEVTYVKERTIDQFSGEFLFLSVREPFGPSDDQIITVKTIITI